MSPTSSKTPVRIAFLLVLSWLIAVARADVPEAINYQGRVSVDGVNFDSATAGHAGIFRFALVSADGATTYWSNDGTSVAGSEPVAGVQIAVSKGLYSVLLGDLSSPLNMQPITPVVFASGDVRLRIWFDDGSHGSQLLSPDQRIASVGYALIARTVPDGAVTAAKIAPGAVGSAHLALDSVQNANIAAGTIGNGKLANSSVTINTGPGLSGGGPLALGGSLTLTIPDGGVGSAQLAANAVQAGNIALGAVGAPQLATGAAIANLTSSGQDLAAVAALLSNPSSAQWLGSNAKPTFAGATLLGSGTGFVKPMLVFDRGIAPKGRVFFERSSQDSGWSGLHFTVNADHHDVNGYERDTNDMGFSALAMEYNWLTPQADHWAEINWTVADSSGFQRRIFNITGSIDDYRHPAWFGIFGRTTVSIPSYDLTPDPALQVEAYKGAGEGAQIVLQNVNSDSPAASAQIVLRGIGSAGLPSSFSTEWSLGTDRYWTGTNNFYLFDGKAGLERLFIDETGKVGINNTAPAAQLDVTGAVNVAGTVNATNFTVNGGPIPNLAKQSVSRFAAELRNYYGTPDTVTTFLLTPSSEVADGASIIKLLSLSPDQWRGKTVKLQMIVGVDGSSGGNLACKLAVAYRNTAMDGTNNNGYNAGDADGSLNNTIMVVTAPTAGNKLLLIESQAMTIPASITALSGGFGLERTPENGDTNTDAAFIVECRVIEQ